MPTLRKPIVLSLLVLALAARAHAWHGPGHARVTRSAVAALPEGVPAFLKQRADAAAHASHDPDLFTRPLASDALHYAEAPEHYFDVERLEGREIPAHRYELLQWCFSKDLPPNKVGLAPYAIREWTGRLTVAFAEHRRWPENEHIRNKVLLYAGHLAHYGADLCMPLHTTIHYDGRVGKDGKSPRTGIHLKTDALIHKLPTDAGRLEGVKVRPYGNLFAGIKNELASSHKLVDRLYALEKQLPALKDPLKPGSPVGEFAAERFNAANLFVARLILTAWVDSAKTKIPKWHRRAEGRTAATAQPDYRNTAAKPADPGERASGTVRIAPAMGGRSSRFATGTAPNATP